MWKKLGIGIFGLTTILCSCISSNKNKEEVPNKFSEYIGRYALKTDLVFEVKEESGLLTLLPSFWGSTQILDSIDKDTYESLLHPRMKFEFKRDSTGKINSLISTGYNPIAGTAHKLHHDEYKAVEFLLKGKLNKSLAKLNDPNEKLSEERVVNLGFNLIRFRRSKAQIAFDFVSEFISKYPNSVDLYQIKGLASLLLNDRENAILAFQEAFQIDSTNSMNISALRLLNAQNQSPIPENAWKLPYSIDDLFKEPIQNEIEDVRNDWKNRDLSTKKYKLEKEQQIEFDGHLYNLQILSHEVHGKKHFGAVLIPKGAKLRSSPIVLELHGVDSRYSPFNLEKAKMLKILKENRLKTIIAIPSFRGNSLTIGDQKYTSEGSPKDAWDGAADDAIAFLNVIIDQVPESDPTRISVFGKSRGGTVAMLVGVRDSRIGSVINWAGPSGWFSKMGTFGWSLQEQVQWALWERWPPGRGWGIGSQFIDWFLLESINSEKSNLRTVRHNILSSSPIYFLESLPSAQMHYGVEDGSVPILNAEALQNALNSQNRSNNKFKIYKHENTRHDQPYPKAYQLTHEFLLNNLSKN